MNSVAIQEVLDKLPARELDRTLGEFLVPVTEVMPDERLGRAVRLMVKGILATRDGSLLAVTSPTHSGRNAGEKGGEVRYGRHYALVR